MARTRDPEKAMALFDFILKYKRDHDGNSPTIQEMAVGMGYKSKSVSHFHLMSLVDMGKIEPMTGFSRCTRVVGGYTKAMRVRGIYDSGELPLVALGLPTWLHNMLARRGFRTVEGLVRYIMKTGDDFHQRVDGLGTNSNRIIMKALREKGWM